MFRWKVYIFVLLKNNIMKNSKILRISETNWKKLKDSNNGSMDKALNILMDTVEDVMPHVIYNNDVIKSVNVYKDTADRLDSFRISDTESRDNILTRLFIAYEEKVAENITEIPFRLTSPINRDLFLIGTVTPKSVTIMSSSKETLEYKAWERLLDFEEIKEICLNHEDERITINQPYYQIDINFL